MITGAPPWREIGVLLVIVLAFAFVGTSIDGLVGVEMVIAGTVVGTVDEDVEVTMIVEVAEPGRTLSEFQEVERKSITVIETIDHPDGNQSVATYSVPVERGGEYRVRARTTGTDEYLAVPSERDRAVLEKYAWPPIDQPARIELPSGERADNVNFTLYDADLITEGEELPDPRGPRSGWSSTQTGGDQPFFVALPRSDFTWLMVAVLSLVGVLALQFVRASGATATDLQQEEQADEGPGAESAEGLDDDLPSGQSDHRHFENEVYRAWHGMARAAGVSNPQEFTPGELEREAVAAGLPADAVSQLTRSFNDVRYGGVDPDVHADDARETLRRIDAAATDHTEDDQ